MVRRPNLGSYAATPLNEDRNAVCVCGSCISQLRRNEPEIQCNCHMEGYSLSIHVNVQRSQQGHFIRSSGDSMLYRPFF
jgi:hypothetical protein